MYDHESASFAMSCLLVISCWQSNISKEKSDAKTHCTEQPVLPAAKLGDSTGSFVPCSGCLTSKTPSLGCWPACRGRPFSTSGLCWNRAHRGGRMGGCCVCRWKATCDACSTAADDDSLLQMTHCFKEISAQHSAAAVQTLIAESVMTNS